MLILLLLLTAYSKDSEKESACSYQVTDFLIKKSEEIQFLFKGQKEFDELGAINKMAQDSFDKCTASITPSQIKSINSEGAQEKFNYLVNFSPKDYLGQKFEATYEFVASLKSKQINRVESHEEL
jgi:hypothetical protein